MSRQRREIFSEINITPLTDIFLVLLIIMMVIAPMLDSKGLKLAVPTVGANDHVTQDPKILTVHIDAQGRYSVNGQQVSDDTLQAEFHQSTSQYPDGVLLETDPNASHGAVVKAMDAARSAGIEKLAVSQAGGV